MTDETWISLDVETSGPAPPGRASCRSGRVSWTTPPAASSCSGPYRDAGGATRRRPCTASPRDRLAAEGVDAAAAMERLAAWVEVAVPAGSIPVLVSFNAPFDWLFIADYCWRYLGHNPFGISAVDLKALFMGRHLDVVRRGAPRGAPTCAASTRWTCRTRTGRSTTLASRPRSAERSSPVRGRARRD